MSYKLSSIEDFLKKHMKNQSIKNGSDTYEEYKHKIGADYDREYGRAMNSLYVNALKNSPSYKENYAELENKGLHNSGYREYLAEKSADNFIKSAEAITSKKSKEASKTLSGYLEYLEDYANKQTKLKNSVSSHLIKSGIANLDTALSYAIAQGLTREDAEAVARDAYTINRQKVLNTILEQAAGLGLDRTGAVLLAKKMGVSDDDAETIGNEVEGMMKYYGNVSDGYLEYLEQKSNKTTNTFD